MIWWAVPAVYLAFFVVLVYRYHRRLPHLSAYPPRAAGPLVSVIIPARDEAANIEACVRSVLATAYQPIEVIVVDDAAAASGCCAATSCRRAGSVNRGR